MEPACNLMLQKWVETVIMKRASGAVIFIQDNIVSSWRF